MLVIVYLDPTNLSNACNENSTLVTDDGCMRWYVFSKDNSAKTVTMILDHNTSNGIQWISESDWNNSPTNLGISYPSGTSFNSDVYNVSKNSTVYGNNKKGPLTLLSQLRIDTQNWDLPGDSYTYTTSNNSYSNYEIDFSNYNARVISAEEIAQIIGNGSWTLSNGDVFFDGSYNNQRGAGGSSYSWLFDNLQGCIDFGCNTNSLNTTSSLAYWTVSPYIGENSNMNWTYAGWSVNFLGYLRSVNSYESGFGVRPVITLPESILLDD